MQKGIKIGIECKPRPDKKSEAYIRLIVKLPGKRPITRNTGFKISSGNWDKKSKMVTAKEPDSHKINIAIAEEIQKLKEEFDIIKAAGSEITEDNVRRQVTAGDTTDFISFYYNYLEFIRSVRKNKQGAKYSKGYIKRLNTIYNHIDKYTGGSLPFSRIDTHWLEKLETHWSKTIDADTTLNVCLSITMRILRLASERGLYDMRRVSAYKLPAYVNPERDYLTLEQVDSIGKLIYDGDLDNEPGYKKVACYFLIECLSGLRFSDWPRFATEKLIKGNSLKVWAKKNGEPVYIPYDKSPRLKRILEYIQDNDIVFDMELQPTNRYLKVIALMTKPKITQNISTHLGRHTAATLLLQMGYSLETVAEWLGITERTVKIYAKNTRQKLQNEYEKLGGL